MRSIYSFEIYLLFKAYSHWRRIQCECPHRQQCSGSIRGRNHKFVCSVRLWCEWAFRPSAPASRDDLMELCTRHRRRADPRPPAQRPLPPPPPDPHPTLGLCTESAYACSNLLGKNVANFWSKFLLCPTCLTPSHGGCLNVLHTFQALLEKTLDFIETVYLKDRDYICGDDITIADLLAVCELMQPMAAGEDIFPGHDKLRMYMERVKARLQPHFDEAHKFIYRLRDINAQSRI